MQLKENLLELHVQKENELNSYFDDLDKIFFILKDEINDWHEKYVLKSPIKGKITLTKYWSENQVVKSGERFATIVPDEETLIIARAFIPSSYLAKIELGQKVNIKLSGFPYMEYGVIKGIVSTISLVPEEKGYVIGIKLLDGMKSSYSETLKFIQQMEGNADIITTETRLIYQLINPLKRFMEKLGIKNHTP